MMRWRRCVQKSFGVKSSLARVKPNNSKSSNLNILKTQYIKIDTKGSKFYYKDREMTILHRDDGPAIERGGGLKEWYLNGKRHREDGPAVVWPDGTKHWYLNGKRHCVDGPAVEYANGSKFWYMNGKRHREDGPAIEEANGSKHWYLNGERLTEKEHAKRTVKEVVVSMDDIAKMLDIPVEKLKIKK